MSFPANISSLTTSTNSSYTLNEFTNQSLHYRSPITAICNLYLQLAEHVPIKTFAFKTQVPELGHKTARHLGQRLYCWIL